VYSKKEKSLAVIPHATDLIYKLKLTSFIYTETTKEKFKIQAQI
jgi:hypothetical protein